MSPIIARILNALTVQNRRLAAAIRSWVTRHTIMRLGGTAGSGLHLRTGAKVSIAPGGKILLGRRVHLAEGAELFVNPGATLKIGDDVFIGKGSVISASASVSVGPGSQIAHYVTIIDSDHRSPVLGPLTTGDQIAQPVEIGANVWVGAHAVVLKGVSIGESSVVAAAAVVPKSIPARHLGLGNPAAHRPLAP